MSSADAASSPEPALVQEVRRALARGWALVPLCGKQPIQKEWTSAPPPTHEEILKWAREGNVGVRTGAVSGIFVIDDDTADGSGAAALRLPPTVTARTGKDRRHHYFRMPAAGLGNSVSRLAKGVDTRGEGGQVVLPGSIHPETGEPYAWLPGHSPEEIELAELPAHVLEMLVPRKHHDSGTGHRDQVEEHRLRRYASAALTRSIQEVVSAPDGERNNTLNACAFSLGHFVGAGLLDRGEVEADLGAAAEQAGLDSREIEATIRSGLDAGIEEPFDPAKLERSTKPAGLTDEEEPPKRKPRIDIEGGDLPEVVDAAELALRDDILGEPVYQRLRSLVRIVRLPAPKEETESRQVTGRLMIVALDPYYLVERLTSAAEFWRIRKTKDPVRVDCPERVAKTLATRGRWDFPVLVSIVEAPTLRRDGTVLDTSGYDEATGLYYDPGICRFDPVPERPTLEDARAALDEVKKVIEHFPFVEDFDRSVALSAILTGLVRRTLRSAPLFVFRAPTMATGKSLLADIVSLFSTGRPAAMLTQGKDENEDRKRFLALLMEGEPVACLDNVDRPLDSAALCSILTQQYYRDRILGVSATATVPTSVTWLATGNNLVVKGDMITRVLVSDLDAQCERPEEREFPFDPRTYVLEHRGRLVPAGLTVLRAYLAAGRPDMSLPVFGRFEAWSDLVRSALVWCGEADPCSGREKIVTVDPVIEQLDAVLRAWVELLGHEPHPAKEVVRLAKGAGGSELLTLLQYIAGRAGEVSAISLGRWLKQHERRRYQGRWFEKGPLSKGTQTWRVAHE